jgi:GNAT superfamily N-acetyltransferase
MSNTRKARSSKDRLTFFDHGAAPQGRGPFRFQRSPSVTDLLTLRPATPADLAGVDALLARSYPKLLARDYPPSVLVTALPLIARARPELMRSGTYWVAIASDGAIVGAGGWTRGAPGDGGRADGVGHVRHVVTDAGRVRQGIGRALMERAIAQAAAAGVRRLDCLSTRTAVPFYAVLGFVARGPVEVPLRPGIVFPAVRMERVLTPQV